MHGYQLLFWHVKLLHKVSGYTGVFANDRISFGQSRDCPQCDVSKVAYRGGDYGEHLELGTVGQVSKVGYLPHILYLPDLPYLSYKNPSKKYKIR